MLSELLISVSGHEAVESLSRFADSAQPTAVDVGGFFGTN